MKFFWFCLTLLTVSTWQLPAWAGQLIFWEFNEQRRELQFRTNSSVQPEAQLIPDPSRLVIDLPGTTLARPLLNRSYGGKIRTVRLGQFTPNTARLVIELEPGYTLDPNGIKFEGRSPNDWSVTLPEPQPITTDNQTSQRLTEEQIGAATGQAEDSFLDDRFQVTRGGFYLNLDQVSDGKIASERDGDRLEFTLKDLQLPQELRGKTLNVNRYRVNQIAFEQVRNNEAKISLQLADNSPEWRALYNSYGGGGLVFIPAGGTDNLEARDVSPTTVPDRVVQTSSSEELTTIESVDLANNGGLLIVRGNESIKASGGWNRNDGVYQIRIENAELAQPVRGPQLETNSPVSRISMRQETNTSVLIQIEPALGVQVGDLTQPSDRLIALELNRLRDFNNSQGNNSVFVPPAQNTDPPRTFNPPQSNIVVMIDPGHGGRDSGAVGIGGLQEKNVILPISQEVAQILQQNGIGVRMTRDTDYFVSLAGRTQLANNANADLFVSIHANAISLSRPDVNGFEVYYFQSGRQLAQSIHRNVMSQIRMRDRGVKTARFYVLRHTAMPSALVEVGFVTGREDAANLSNPAFRSRMAKAIADGILEYIQTNVR
ncbi:N-acetylmuramoyl-L-alanine amidase [[Limnothrix rosea] IAM M-220]|uniref:N-acetylmuramoyl-L-alanine amidase n=1 Tax=[Limnothrix rosea] IAM M-220 TaxID=454133 RepID=UPI00096653FC|nr:N-acetylmuramoyl-L-alanine amidase [[Limnothrix rosea] IAM M-220]OKH17476.1 N-acetylmuramoyl-L-alanine amidase [[Limnothrix rosea] IAM M-220]